MAKDGPIRATLKGVALVRRAVGVGLARLWLRLRGKPRYRLRGSCNGCGRCCERPTVSVGLLVNRFVGIRAIFLAWHRWVNGFLFVDHDTEWRTIAFRCTHYDPESGLCDSYATRPWMCRDYPRNLLYAPVPEFFDECGYYAVDRYADRIRASLRRIDIDEETLVHLEEKLHVRE